MMPAVTLGADALPDHLVAHGTAVITTMRQLLGSTGVAVATLVLAAGGFRLVFWSFFVLELVGLGLALTLKERRQEKPNN